MLTGAVGLPPVPKDYVLSDTYRYDLQYLDDSGPRYARDMQWPVVPFASLAVPSSTVAIVDNRIRPDEIAALSTIVRQSPGRLFVFTLVDPFVQQNEDGPYREFLLTLIDAPNVVFLSKYHPAEFTARLRDAVGASRFLALHYPYVRAKESTPVRRRSPRMVFAGAIDAAVYPERESLYTALRRRPWLRSMVRHVAHPGYPEVGDEMLHQMIGSRFVQMLSGHHFMFVSGSRCDLEFLKYRECAYAGCVPVGLAPASFPQALRDCILPLDPEDPWPTLWRGLRRSKLELQQRAARFAQLQHELRSPEVLNRDLDEFLRPHIQRIVRGNAEPAPPV